jgi:hypothetical protein
MTGQVKEKMITFRTTEALNDDIEKVHDILEKERDPHLSKVTKSETMLLLIKLGLEEFKKKRGLK